MTNGSIAGKLVFWLRCVATGELPGMDKGNGRGEKEHLHIANASMRVNKLHVAGHTMAFGETTRRHNYDGEPNYRT